MITSDNLKEFLVELGSKSRPTHGDFLICVLSLFESAISFATLFFFLPLCNLFLEYAELSFKKQIHRVCFMFVSSFSIFLAVVFDNFLSV